MRLTNEIRNNIINSVIIDVFKTRTEANKAMLQELALQCRDKLLGKHKDAFFSLPSDFVKNSHYIHVNIDGMSFNLHFSDSYKKIPCPNTTLVLKKNSLLGKKVFQTKNDEDTIFKEKTNLRKDIKALVYSFNTTKQLVEAWPEAKPYIPAESTITALTIRPEDINKQIKKAKAA